MDSGEYGTSVISNWNEMKACMFSEKCWVNPKDVNVRKQYEAGDFLRVWCCHDECWCSASLGIKCCTIYVDHIKE